MDKLEQVMSGVADINSNIDDYSIKSDESVKDEAPDTSDVDTQGHETHDTQQDDSDYQETESQSHDESSKDVDDYGNEKKERYYTWDEVKEHTNQAIRKRLGERKAESDYQPQKNQQAYQQQQDGNVDYEAQLREFVLNTTRQAQIDEANRQQEILQRQQAEEFESKFHSGMERFNDFYEVVKEQPVSDGMVRGMHAMRDPASFIYAASKRAPKELERISKITNEYQAIVEINKLEENLRNKSSASKAPKPVSHSKSDANIDTAPSQRLNIEDLMHEAATDKLKSKRR